jgi:7-cyano-7-deazaguanine synthase in queuosine biosynthesis
VPKKIDRSLLLRRSERLAKKSSDRSSNPVVAAQNVLMRKLGVLKGNSDLDAAVVLQYSNMCTSGLSDCHTEAIDELFPDHIPLEEDDSEEELEDWA